MFLKGLTERQKGVLFLLLLALIYGIMPLLPRYLSLSFTLLQQIYLRVFFGGVVLWIFFFRQIQVKKLATLPLKEWGILLFRAISYFVLGVVLYNQALLLTKITNVVLIETIPATSILGFILLKEKVTRQKLALILLSALGVAIITVKDTSHFSFGTGELVTLASLFFVSIGLILRKWHSKALNDQEISAFTLIIAGILIFCTSLIKGDGLPLYNWSIPVIGVILIGIILNAGLGFCMNYGLSRVDAVLSGNILSLQTVFAAVLAFLVFGEIPLLREIEGGILIIISAILMNRYENKKG